MLKRSLPAVLLFTAISCGGHRHADVPATANDSAPSTKTIPQSTDLKINSGANNQGTTSSATDISMFIPENYSMLDTASGDLNLDPYPDMLLVLKKNGEDSTSNVAEHPEKRPLLILLGQTDHSYKLAARNDNAVYCFDCGGMMGDPYQEVVIKKGYFSIGHYGGSAWRWTRTITFKYAKADNKWFLHKDGSESFHATDPEKATTKIRTVKDFGKIAFEQFDIYKED